MDEKKVKELAETLHKQGLAASMYEAVEKAKSILNGTGERSEEKEEQPSKEEDMFSKPDYDAKKEEVAVNELMQEIGVTPEQVAEQEKQKVDYLKEEVQKRLRKNIRSCMVKKFLCNKRI